MSTDKLRFSKDDIAELKERFIKATTKPVVRQYLVDALVEYDKESSRIRVCGITLHGLSALQKCTRRQMDILMIITNDEREAWHRVRND